MKLHAGTSTGGYEITFEPGGLDDPAQHIQVPTSTRRIALVADATTAGLYGHLAARSFASAADVETFVLPPGEQAKDVATLDALWRFLAASGFHRGDLLVALGGGVVGDVAGFAAATFHRGISWALLPTTLLAMVDSSIGGKTAIDLPEGKNLAGAFHAPLAVLTDPLALQTLPPDEFTTGLAEVVKHGLISTGNLGRMLDEHRDAINARDPDVLAELVPAAAEVKVRIVSEDEKERGSRAWLNYGHTLGHAIEAVESYRGRSHGRAVAVGMRFVARLAPKLGYPDLIEEHERRLASFGLLEDCDLPDHDLLIDAMSKDKKFDDGLVFVLLEDLGRPVTARVDEALIRETLAEMP